MKKKLATIACAVLAIAGTARAQEFPQKAPLEITCLFPAGSSADVTARMLADGMSAHLGQRVLVVNRPGAGGAIGYKHVASQKPDGYSLVWNSNSISTTYHSGQLPFDYKAFEPVAHVLVESVVVAVRADSPWHSLKEFIASVKSRGKGVSVGHSGVGSHTHISLAALEHAADVQANEVPFGASQVIPSLLGGHVDAVVQFPGALSGPVKQGQVRLLATLTTARDPAFPEVRTAREQGYDVALDGWRGVAAPRGTPERVVAQLEKAIRETVDAPEFKTRSEALGVRPAYLPAAKFGEEIARDDEAISRLMELIGLKKH
jgi:tripartite-type tricarboxylate transporter receptor subunit TctC